MKRIRYRLYALLLVITLIFSGNAAAAQASDTAEKDGFIPMAAREFEALSAMGLLTEDFLTMSANTAVNRAQFVGALYKLAGYSEIKMENPFSDVDETTPYRDAISYFYNTRIINGTSGSTFSPYSEITYNQAIKMAVNFLGYKINNSVNTSSYSGFIEAAYKFELLDGIKASSFDSALSGEAAVVLLYNCAIADMVEVIKYQGNGQVTSQINKDTCILSEHHSIYSGRGTMDVSVDGELSLDDKVSINGTEYFTEGRDYSEYLGYKVRYFYKDTDGDAVLLWVMPEAVNSVLTISSEELLTDDGEYGYDSIVYKKEGTRRTVAKVDLYADIVYNYTLSNNATIDMIKPKVGNITLVDNDSDSHYDVVIIREYKNLFVNAISLDENFISDRYGSPLMLEDYEYVKLIKNGVETELNQINNNCIVSYLASPDKKYLYAYVCDSGVSETLISVETDSDDPVYEFESGEYFVSSSLIDVIKEGKFEVPEIKAGRKYWYYLDVTGRIAAVKEASDNQKQYAYLIEICELSGFANKDSVKMEVVLQDGTQTFVKTAKKLKIDDVENQKGTDLPLGEVGEVVKITFDKDGEVKEIDFAEALDQSANPYGYDKTRFTLDYSETNSFYYRNYLFGNRYSIGSETVCFATFKNKDGSFDYGVVRMSDIVNNATYENVKIYDCDEYRDIGALCIDINRRDRFLSGHILVDEVRYVLDEEDGEYYPQIRGFVKGEEVAYTVKDEYSILSEVDLKRGDIVRCSTYLDVVYRVELVCRLSNPSAPFIDTTTLARQSDSRVFGYLYSNNGNNIVLYNPNGWSYGGNLLVTKSTTSLANLRVSVYDAGTDSVYAGSAKDLYHTSAPRLDGSISIPDNTKKVFIYREAENVGEIIVAYY